MGSTALLASRAELTVDSWKRYIYRSSELEILIEYSTKKFINLECKINSTIATASSAPGSPLSKHIQHITMSHFTLTSNRAYSISISTVGAFNRRSTHRYISISHISLKFTFFLCRCSIIVVKSHLDEHKTN